MTALTLDLLRSLSAAEGCSLSVYLPIVTGGREIRQNSIRLRNVLDRAAAALAERQESGRAPAWFDRVHQLGDDANLWNRREPGLVIFASEDHFSHHWLPMSVPELWMVGERFYVTPLLPIAQDDDRFEILGLSINRVRLVHGWRTGALEVRLPDSVPQNLADAVGHELTEQSLQFHTRPTSQDAGPTYHGHGGGELERKPEVRHYLKRVHDSLWDLSQQDPWNSPLDWNVPLVLACVEAWEPLFREISRHTRLVDRIVSGSPDDWSAAEIHERAWPLVERLLAERREQNLSRAMELGHGDQVARSIPKIIELAAGGRVDTLFVAEDRSGDGSMGDSARALNDAVVQTLLHGGHTVTVREALGPGGAVALLRW